MATIEDKFDLAVHSLKINQLAETLGSGGCSLRKAIKRRYTNEGFITFINSLKLTEDEITSTVDYLVPPAGVEYFMSTSFTSTSFTPLGPFTLITLSLAGFDNSLIQSLVVFRDGSAIHRNGNPPFRDAEI
ncbi:hypothetical protein LXL04_013876 [Taraxacum kok-saghyz]